MMISLKKIVFEQPQWKIRISLFFFFFLVFFYPVNESVNPDEMGFVIVSRGLKTIRNYVVDYGKGPFSMFIHWIFIKLFGTNYRIGQFVGATFGALSACVAFELARVLSFSRVATASLILGSAFFSFYARTVMQDIYVIFFSLLMFLGTIKLKSNFRLGASIIFIAAFFGILTRTSLLLFFALLPVFIFFEDERALFPKKFKNILVYLCFVSIGVVCALVTYRLFGPLDGLKSLHSSCVRPISEVLKVIFHFKEQWAYQTVLIDLGWGGVLGIIFSSIFVLVYRPVLAIVGIIIIVSMIEYLSLSAVAGKFSRYLVLLWPVIFLWLSLFYKAIQSAMLKKAVLAVVLVGQLMSVYQTTFPLIFDPANAKWPADEFDQHFGRLTSYGWNSIQNEIDSLVDIHGAISLKCINKIIPEDQQYVGVLCSYYLARNDERANSKLATQKYADQKQTYWIIIQRAGPLNDDNLQKIYAFDRTLKDDSFKSEIIIAKETKRF